MIANAIHHNSNRASGPFIKINCAAIPKDLIESELFGYKKGAFTGAGNDKVGLLEMAEGGSLLLDEIGEMPPYLQTKLLRVLQEREYRPVGSDRLVNVDFRLICATNIDLEVALKRRPKLRETCTSASTRSRCVCAPLRERTEDIPLLCNHFLSKFNQRYQKSVRSIVAVGVSPADPQPLARQRPRARERDRASCAGAQGGEIQPGDLAESIREEAPPTQDFTIPPHRTLAEIEKMAIVQTLQRTNWNKQEARRFSDCIGRRSTAR
jgi:transcriptional regulator with GAF, ATPase, and Fis domain